MKRVFKSRVVRTRIRRMGICLVPFLCLAGCARQEELAAVEQTELRIVYSGGDANWKACLEEVAEQFTEENPEIAIELYSPENRENRLYSDQLKILYAKDEFYDVLELREPEKVSGAGWLAQMPEEVTELIRPEFLEEGEKHYIPIYQMNRGVIYNKDIFDALGLREPQSYEEFLSCCETIRNAGYNPVVVGGEDLWHMEFWGNYLFVNYMLDEKQNVVWTRERAQEMLQSFRGLYEAGYVEEEYRELSDSETVQEIAAERAVMLQTGAWMLPQIMGMNPEINLGFFFLTGAGGKTYAVQDMSNCWGISEECAADQEKYEAAIEFLRFFYSEDIYEKVLESMTAASVTVRETDTADMEAERLVEEAYAGNVTFTGKLVSSLEAPDGFRNSFNQILRETLWGTTPVDELAEALISQWEGEK